MNKMEKTFSAGTDLGTSSVKFFGANERKFRLPSIIGKPNPGFSGATVDESWEQNLNIQMDGENWYVGKLAQLQSTLKFSLASEGRMKNFQNARIALISALSLLASEKGEYFSIASGVPVGVSEKKMEQLGDVLKGSFQVSIKNDATGEEKSVFGKVVSSLVMPEPYGAYFYQLKTQGEVQAQDSVIIDIGYGTTDILTIYKGSVLRGASSSINEAVDTLTVKLADKLSDAAGTNIKPEELMSVLEKEGNKVTVGGKTFNISEQIRLFSRQVARAITDEIIRVISNIPPDAVIPYHILEGGGSYLFGDIIEEQLLQKGIINNPSELIIPDDPVFANAKGFQLIADRYSTNK